MKQTESECLCKPMTQWDYRAWLSVQCFCVLRGISIDPLTSLPNVASISHLIYVLSTQCSTRTYDRVTCCSPTHTSYTQNNRTCSEGVHCYINLDYFGFDRIFSYIVFSVVDFAIFFSCYVFHVLGLNWISQYISCYWQIH